MTDSEQEIDIRNNPESRAGASDTTQRIARAADGGPPPKDAPAAGTDPEPVDEGTRGGDPLAGLHLDADQAEHAVSGDTGPDELDDSRAASSHP